MSFGGFQRAGLRALFLGACLMGAAASPAPDNDQFQWLEEVEGEKAIAWVRAQNERSLKVLQEDPRYADLHEKALAIVNATDRIPSPAFRGGQVYNFWQDEVNVRGLLRRTSLESYKSETPAWEAVLDIDQLAKVENANWVYKGASCLPPDEQLCLANLSDGGKDAVEIREFDNKTLKFAEAGFKLSAGKQSITWADKDTVYVAREWGPGTMTESGYPFIIKRWKRGTPIDAAVEVFRGTEKDVSAQAGTFHDPDGTLRAVMMERYPSFFEVEVFLLGDNGTSKLPFPPKSGIKAFVSGQVVFTIEQEWTHRGKTYPQGGLLSYDIEALKSEGDNAVPTLILAPGPRESIEQVAGSKTRLLVALYENVKGALYSYRFDNGSWAREKAELPENASIGIVAARDQDDQVFVNVASFVDPDALYLGDATTGKFEKVKSLPPRFDSSNMVVEQFEVASSDGAKIPYFVMRPKEMKLDGSNPTLLYGYGGFQVSMTPTYSANVGKLWVERGGVYVLANIRGGGEFGPAWHQAGLKTNRQIIFDDFAAVAKDLIDRKITSPRRLGIQGGSNGGLLVGVEMTQKPELWNAVVIQVPLLDMLRFDKLLAGASWTGEYGDPDDATEAAFLRKISPYHNLKSGVTYPEPFFVTSTKDDRVHPGHARKMAAKMAEMKLPFYYYENIDGGHSAAANLQERAKRIALEFTYLTRKLID
jgi:prolyl oligopeptidase